MHQTLNRANKQSISSQRNSSAEQTFIFIGPIGRDMAVFLINICKFNGCGITFPSLGDLIQHIEDTHIDYDPKVVEQKEQAQPACLPLSYVLRFISEDARKESPFLSANTSGVELKRKLAIKHHSYSMSSSNRSNTPTGSEMDDDEMVVSESEDSNDSWTTEEFSSEFIMRYGSRHSGTGSNGTPGNEKPFACPVPGCKKRYKNVNGIKYHSKNGHKKDGKVRKGYKCHCGKSYKTAQGLKNHALVSHNSSPESVLSAQHVANITNTSNGTSVNASGIILQRSSSPSQSLGSLSPSSISNMSSSASSCHGSASGTTYNGNSNSAGNIGGSNTTSSVVTNNVLQQLTNGSLGNGSPNVVATTNGVGLNLHHHQHHQPQQQQHQFSSQQQPQLQSIGSSATASSEQMNASNSACMPFNGQLLNTVSSMANANNTAINSRVSAAVIGATPVATVAVSVNGTPMNAAGAPNNNIVTPIFGTSPIISPTFIEHKYSANTFKQRFLANLRANHGGASKPHINSNNGSSNNNNNTKIGHSKHSICNNNPNNSCDADNTNGDIITANAIKNGNVAAGGGLVVNPSSDVPEMSPIVGIDDLCSIQQQLSENYNKSAMYPRTIN